MHSDAMSSWGFITNGGVVSIAVAIGLISMSVVSWYLILTKGFQAMRLQRQSNTYIQTFWQATSVQTVVSQSRSEIPAARMAQQAVAALEHYQQHTGQQLADVCNQDEFVARSLRRAIAEENAQIESGLTILASVGSVSPFIGLFGTVWGIYHALASISLSGQATLDKVAGPVGEALIMTALGLAVAIPAVLAYNALVRSNRVLTSQLETFAHDLHTFLTMGVALSVSPKPHKSGDGLHKQQKSTAQLKEVVA
jgi:biopolymer transport protein ExbB